MMESDLRSVLIIDDDPVHLEIYGLILEKAGFRPIPVLVKFNGVEFQPDADIAIVVLDYCLNSIKTAPEVAQEAKIRYPGAPVLVLSDVWSMPADIAPYAAKFVRKGEPQQLIDAIRTLLVNASGVKA
jgi:DNA-binding NtrC family response regulator